MPANKKPSRHPGKVRTPQKHTPYIFRQTEEQSLRLKAEPYVSLENFRNNHAVAKDWHTLYFRLHVGFFLAEEHYTAETHEALAECIIQCEAVWQHWNASGETEWMATVDQIESIRAGLEATDAMQDATTRRQQMVAHLSADRVMKKLSLRNEKMD